MHKHVTINSAERNLRLLNHLNEVF